MPQNKEEIREQTKLRVQRYRDKQRSVTNSGDNVTQSPESVTIHHDNVTGDVTQYPAIVYALTDPVKRKKMEQVCQSLKTHKQVENVYYGYPGLSGVPFDVIGDLLDATA